ncbi:MAG: septation regulator SpoVG [Clostridia bacterium]|nr:septation regulator SpoVG [Clostridia bacterium]
MHITDVKFRHLQDDSKLKALVSVTFDDVFAVHDIKVIEGHDRLFLAMPSRRMPDGKYRDIVHPIGNELRDALETRVITEYLNATQPQ